jgi:hypothetical protein
MAGIYGVKLVYPWGRHFKRGELPNLTIGCALRLAFRVTIWGGVWSR